MNALRGGKCSLDKIRGIYLKVKHSPLNKRGATFEEMSNRGGATQPPTQMPKLIKIKTITTDSSIEYNVIQAYATF